MTNGLIPECTKLFIDGEWREAKGGSTFALTNPATEEKLCDCASAQEEDVTEAVAAARACFEGAAWGRNSTPEQRAGILRKVADALEADKEAFTRLETQDCGKPLKEAAEDVGDAIGYFRFYANLADELGKGAGEEELVLEDKDFQSKVVKEPLGVIGAITPWNFPLVMAVQKVAAALAAGCTVVLKPSELAPLTCLRLAGLVEAAGLPAGALNVVTGLGPVAGAALSASRDVNKVSFTGSVATGKTVMCAAAAGPRGVSLELGGKSPMILFEDADIPACIDWICMGIFFNSGQVCSATSRLLVHESVYDKVVEGVLERAAAISVGDPLREGLDAPVMGPLVSGPQRDKVLGFLTRAKNEGAQVLCGGGPPDDAASLGYYVAPTVLAGVSEESEVWKEEIFGPVLCVRKFSTEEEAVATANKTEYGLAAAVMTADGERCDRVARRLHSGIVWKNCSQPTFIQAPWGGVGKSGIGRELGKWGLEGFLSVKQITGCASDFQWNWYGGDAPAASA